MSGVRTGTYCTGRPQSSPRGTALDKQRNLIIAAPQPGRETGFMSYIKIRVANQTTQAWRR